ncbi:MAG: SIMPL domain-containing protein, partial [Halobacteriaceae archaeon]
TFERDERRDIPKYRGQHSFVVTLNKTDRAGKIVVIAVQNGATSVEEVQFTITQQTRRDLRKQALAKAIENAHGKASVMANGTGLTLTGVRTVQTSDVSIQPIQKQAVAFAAAGGDGGDAPLTSFEGGKVTVSAQVTVVYNATST